MVAASAARRRSLSGGRLGAWLRSALHPRSLWSCSVPPTTGMKPRLSRKGSTSNARSVAPLCRRHEECEGSRTERAGVARAPASPARKRRRRRRRRRRWLAEGEAEWPGACQRRRRPERQLLAVAEEARVGQVSCWTKPQREGRKQKEPRAGQRRTKPQRWCVAMEGACAFSCSTLPFRWGRAAGRSGAGTLWTCRAEGGGVGKNPPPTVHSEQPADSGHGGSQGRGSSGEGQQQGGGTAPRRSRREQWKRAESEEGREKTARET